jgi:hypothetical protein
MARMQRRRRFVNGPGRNRPSWWARHHAEGNSIVGSPANFDVLADYKQERGIASIDPGTTLSGGWISFVHGNGGTGGPFKVAVGLIVVDENTSTQVPDPFTDPHVDWFFYWVGYMAAGETITLPAERQQIRARRRLDEIGMNVYASVRSQAAGPFQLDTSLLLKLR